MRIGLGLWAGRRLVHPQIDFGWQEIGITAGTDGTQWVGYSDGGDSRPQPSFGTISAQPTDVTNLLALYDDTNSNVYLAVFEGDYVSSMHGLPMSIGGSPFTPFETTLVSGNTWVRYNGVGDWIIGDTYQVFFG